eukprot:76622-Amphidinium_carterae.2
MEKCRKRLTNQANATNVAAFESKGQTTEESSPSQLQWVISVEVKKYTTVFKQLNVAPKYPIPRTETSANRAISLSKAQSHKSGRATLRVVVK